MHAWWASVPGWAEPVILAAAITATLAVFGWLFAKVFPAVILWWQERKAEKCRIAVADALRPEVDIGLTETEIAARVNECSPKEIEKAIRYWEEKGLIRPAPRNRWVWQPSKLRRG